MFERKNVGEILLFGIEIARIDHRGHRDHGERVVYNSATNGRCTVGGKITAQKIDR